MCPGLKLAAPMNVATAMLKGYRVRNVTPYLNSGECFRYCWQVGELWQASALLPVGDCGA